ncbi:NAD-glutamate dehydrogenase [Devosia albogilva]|uniref:NAD-glutamate dehydrogenase n=1 Tax=Devosia albogilva TaxID=429726 RepID=A0ABW5QN77_9HYPH
MTDQAAVTSRVEQLADKEAGLALLLEQAQRTADPEDLSKIPLEEFEAHIRQAMEHLLAHRGESSEIHLTPPATAGAPLVIDVISPDMPFIVDSALAAVRAAGGTIRLVVHPVVSMEAGRISQNGGLQLSMLHIHSDPVADPETLREEIARTMRDVAWAVGDWQPMLTRVRQAMGDLETAPAPKGDEPLRFLDWLTEHNFTFLGMRSYELTGDRLEPVAGSGLGILRDPDVRVLRSGAEFVESTPELVEFVASGETVLVTKANVRSRVHRRQHLDYVGVKLRGPDGSATGELRIVGLFTAQALAAPHTDVPLVRRKIAEVMRRSGFDPRAHDGRALMSALDSYPRDELFQVSTSELAEYAATIASLYDRPRVRVLPRIDRFDNFVSVLVFVPRDRYDVQARVRITQYLAKAYDGRVSAYYPHFPEGELVRLHVIIGRVGGETPRPSRSELEARVAALTSNFGDLLVAEAGDAGSVSDYRDAFSDAYRSRHDAATALADIAILRGLGDEGDVAMRLRQRQAGDGTLALKFYHRGTPLPLSQRVPMLEAFGFTVIAERTYTVIPRDGVERFIHDMLLEVPGGLPDFGERAGRIEAGLHAVWSGEAESDQINTLVTTVGLDWTEAAWLRALSRYLRQVGTSFSQRYIAAVLVRHAGAAAGLVSLIKGLHDPAVVDREAAAEAARAQIRAALEATTSLDEDTIIRRFLNLIEASLRTNAFQRDEHGAPRPALAIKFDSRQVDGMPEPRPYREISVYSPRVEGIHLRFGAIARGGIRWSDRPEDFRTEVLGLVKAQQVKNSVIVPVGAKGGFVPKRLVAGMPREAMQAEGVAAYSTYVEAMLDVTDNLVAGAVEPPRQVVRRDGDDPYLVVAADKGTASFSDTANAIAVRRGFWLGDAFASGGSAGYDHKKMGITARGAWEAVKRHFREMDRDIQREPFTVAGVGDMSGDVFGNGMLLSRHIRLVAAFDHRDIFIDPDPDAETSYAERERLFRLPRSSWQDYDRNLISAGGGVFPRNAKSIPLSSQMQSLLGISTDHAAPAAVISAILQAEVDLLWFGGIGTYVRSSQETDADVGDRANDAIRVSADTLRAKVVGEGANLGVTQRARVEFALAGGRINTDAIDNSAGVNSSDLEVNIKIALQPLVASGTMGLEARNDLLVRMTDEVAALCLENNYLQTLALSLAERTGAAELPDHRELMEALVARGELDRAVEFLPTDSVLDTRAATGRGLTRSELAVLMAYAKLTLNEDLLESPLVEDGALAGELFRYFPETLHREFPEAIEGHRLRREVIATVLANAMINRGGPAFVTELTSATSAGPGEIALAYVAAREVFGLEALNAQIESLDGIIAGAVQLELQAAVMALLRQETLWFLRHANLAGGLVQLVEIHRAGAATLARMMPHGLPSALRDAVTARAARMEEQGVPSPLAQRLASLPVMGFASDVVLVAERAGVTVEEAAEAFFGLFGDFGLGPVLEQARALQLPDRYDRMALDRALANLLRAQRDLAGDVLRSGDGPVPDRLEAWRQRHERGVSRTAGAMAALAEGTLTVSRLSVTAGLLSDLAQEG